jgi:excisionase family DNA binding protein
MSETALDPARTVAQACVQLGIGKTKFYELLTAGEIETFTHPTRNNIRPSRRVRQSAIDRYLRDRAAMAS